MLKEVSFVGKVKRDVYDALIVLYRERLSALQKKARELGIPVVILLEGIGRAERKKLISGIAEGFDPGIDMGCTPHAEKHGCLRICPYWLALPAKGHIAVFDRGWYRKAGAFKEGVAAEEIVFLEKQLSCSGYALVKLLLHMPRKEQLRLSESKKSCRLAKKEYARRLSRYDRVLAATDCVRAPWTIVPVPDIRTAEIYAYEAILSRLDNAVQRAKEQQSLPADAPEAAALELEEAAAETPLAKMEPGLIPGKREYRKQIKRARVRLLCLGKKLRRKGIPMAVILEGSDSKIKEGCLRQLNRALDPRLRRAAGNDAVDGDDDVYPYYRRFFRLLPGKGEFTLFSRSWYGQLFAGNSDPLTGKALKNACADICEFEKQIVSCGGVFLKIWLHSAQEQQLPENTDVSGCTENAENGEEIAIAGNSNSFKVDEEILIRTDTAWAPWIVIDAGSKRYARAAVLEAAALAVLNRPGRKR